jgi:hypothetical protein
MRTLRLIQTTIKYGQLCSHHGRRRGELGFQGTSDVGRLHY